MSVNLSEFLQKIDQLQKEIKDCKEDKKAILLQKKLVDFLTESLKNEEVVRAMALDKQKKNQK